MFRVVVYDQAKDDMLRNATWWAENRSMEDAVRWLNVVEGQLNDLARFPLRFEIAAENRHFKYEIRGMPVGLGRQR